MKAARLVLTVALCATGLISVTSRTTSAHAASANPLYAFTLTGASPLPWAATNLESQWQNVSAVGTPSFISADGVSATAVLTSTGQLDVLQSNAGGTSTVTDLSALRSLPTPAASPVAFFDPWNNVDVAYVATNGQLVVVATAGVEVQRHDRLRGRGPLPDNATQVATSNTQVFASGTPSIALSGLNGLLVARAVDGDAIALSLAWSSNTTAPVLGPVQDVSAVTGVGTVLDEPVALAGAGASLFAAETTAGHVNVFAPRANGGWSDDDLTALDSAPVGDGELAGASNGTSDYVAALTVSGHVELFTGADPSTPAGSRVAHVITNPSPTWSYENVTNLAGTPPPLDGTFYLGATDSQLTIAGQTQSWGNLYALTSPLPTQVWSATDVSQTASNSSYTVGPGVTGAIVNGQLTLEALSTGVIAPGGVGVYAIPVADDARAISDGWPILSDTGGLGAASAPWVQTVPSANVASTSDFQLGQSIQNAHANTTWLSFWTVSGPMAGEPVNATTFYNHGYAAGAAVATQIDAYASHGLSLKPAWVILDPEGYPDLHSGLDAPSDSAAMIGQYTTYWSAMLNGWSAGMASVDPTLKAAVYAEMSQYRDYDLANLTMPVFEAIAFPNPQQLPGSTGANVMGYIAFGASCTPASTLQNEIATLLGPPWSGAYNTLQFNANVYCAP